MKPGIAFALLAYGAWGVFPLYFRLLRSIPAFEVLMHRVVWSLVVMTLVLAALRRGRWIIDAARDGRLLTRYGISALSIAINWFAYIWSVQNGHVVDASLGYFITPLFSVLAGRLVLDERPRPVQWTAIAIASCGVVWLGVAAGPVPWIGLVIATSFSAYGLAKKTAPLGALEGLALETALLFPIAICALLWLASRGQNALETSGASLRLLLIASGPLTALPLVLFAAAARRIPLTTLGLLQYVSPTLQLVIGVLVVGEPFGVAAMVGYALIWSALALYAGESLWRARRSSEPVMALR